MGRLYQDDFYGWAADQVDALRRRSLNEIDWDNLLEEIEDLGASKRRELESRLGLIVQHLLKWRCQPAFRSTSWMGTIKEQRRQVSRLLKKNPSLHTYLEEALTDARESGAVAAVRETGFALSTFQETEPLSFRELMDAPLTLDEEGAQSEA